MDALMDAISRRLAEERVHEAADTVMAAWDELANAIGLRLEGRATMERVELARERLARAERMAHAEVMAELRMIGGVT